MDILDKSYILGVDECGTGSLASILVVCGVLAPKSWFLDGINDSKKLTKSKRQILSNKLKSEPIKYYIAERSNTIIDSLGMGIALKEAYIEVFNNLYINDSLIICDGTLKFDTNYDQISIIKADSKIPAVMAASILGKVHRDQILTEQHNLYPQYNWKKNVGYGSKEHLEAITKYGPCPLHRYSYAPIKKY